jgi:hypothetical protein
MKMFLEPLIRLFLGGFFLYAGAIKLWDVATFTQAVEQYRLVTGALAWAVALWIPWIECLAGIGLWVKPFRTGSLWILAGLLLVFEGILLTALARGLDISCGCLGSGGESGILLAFIRNLVLMALVLGLMFMRPRST